MKRSSAGGEARLPLALTIGLDVLAAFVRPIAGSTRIDAADPEHALAAAAWLEAPGTRRSGDRAGALLVLPGSKELVIQTSRELPPGGRIGALVPGSLAPLFERLRGSAGAVRPDVDAPGAFRAAGLSVSLRCAIGAPASPFCALLVRAAARAERPDLVDRFELAYRRSLAPRPGSRLGEYLVVGATRPA